MLDYIYTQQWEIYLFTIEMKKVIFSGRILYEK